VLLIFDLDGTLIDSAADLAIAMNATRQYAGMPPLDPQLIYSYVGNGAATLVKRALGPAAPDDQCEDALQFFMRFYRQHSLEHTRLYPGIQDMLDELRAAGHTLAVLTNKPQRISTDILKGLGLGEHFFRIYGGGGPIAKKPDPVGVVTLLRETAHSPAVTAMIGDSSVDIETARNAGVFACGVTWGFQPDSMTAAQPDLVVHQPRQLVEWVEEQDAAQGSARS
jgi:phosphoglycolate phosphatase